MEMEGGFRDGPFEQALFNLPQGITYVAEAHVLYVADCDNHRIRTVDLNTRMVSVRHTCCAESCIMLSNGTYKSGHRCCSQ